jgi:hypothetical protein
MVYVEEGPLHPLALGVTVITAVKGVLPELLAVKAGTLPAPLPASPILVLEFVHE